jgi:hypothetical protein
MPAWFRIALMWLLAFALPMQGWAAATMTHCGPSHHRTAAMAMESHEGHVHEVALPTVADPSDGLDPSDHEQHQPDHISSLKCSACATCCMGSGLPSAAQTVHAMDRPHSAQATIQVTHAVFLTSGLDRPPRPSLV